MGVKFGMEEGTFGPLLHAKFHPHRCNVLPLRGEKPQNRPLSKLNTGRFALHAMLPVTSSILDRIWYQKQLVGHVLRHNGLLKNIFVGKMVGKKSATGWKRLNILSHLAEKRQVRGTQKKS